MPESFERGALTEAAYYILISLFEPAHGYAVMQNISKISGGRVVLGAGTLYGALNMLAEKRWISAVGNTKASRKKEYIITGEGKSIVAKELKRLAELLKNGKESTEGKLA